MSSETNRKYEFASQSALLFAYLVDQFESERLHESVTTLLSSAVGARNALAYDAEITLLSNLLYLVPSVLGSGRTPGHSFCDFLLVKLPPLSTRDGNHGDQLSTSKETTVRPLTTSERLLLPTVLAIVPYILSRRYAISKGVLDLYVILTSSEQEEQGSSVAMLTTQGDAGSEVIDDDAHTSSRRAGVSIHNDLSSWRTSILGVLYTSMVSAVAALGSDYKVVADGLTGFLQDIHRYLFLLDGRFYEFALRLLRVRLVTSSSSRSKISLRPLSWLVAFRISLLVYYFCRVLLCEIDKQQRAAPVTEDNRVSAIQLRDSGAAAETDLISQSPHKCSLCLDRLTHPGAIPCGHVFCWTCIVSYVHSSSSDRAASTAIATVLIRCPICRFEFTGQKVRALYSYS